MSDTQTENRISDRRTGEQIGWLIATILSLGVYQVAMKYLYWDLHPELGLAEPVTWLAPLLGILLVTFVLYHEAGWVRIPLVSLAVLACAVVSAFQAGSLLDTLFVNKKVLFRLRGRPDGGSVRPCISLVLCSCGCFPAGSRCPCWPFSACPSDAGSGRWRLRHCCIPACRLPCGVRAGLSPCCSC